MTLRDFLTQNDLASFIEVFEGQHISIADLADLGDDDLSSSFGMVRFMDRKRFHAGVARLGGAVAPSSLDGPTRMGAMPLPVAQATQSGAASANPALPAQLGSYRILGPIGAGGMGVVVRARHIEEAWAVQQGGDVAIKLILPALASDPEFRSRFMAEAAMGRKVQHPGFVPTFDVIAEGPWLGTVMSFVTGEQLSAKVRTGGLPVAEVLALLVPIAESLDYLHGLGIVHRDLKPANIIVRPDGHPVVLDLGIAKDNQSNQNQTRTATAMGTSAWMAPEQADAKHVDGAADRYALGMIAYVLLSGKMPWEEGTSEARVLVSKLMGQLAPLESVRTGLPPYVVAAVTRMVAVDPTTRYSSCTAFAQALRGSPAPVEAEAQAAPSTPQEKAAVHSLSPDAEAAKQAINKLSRWFFTV